MNLKKKLFIALGIIIAIFAVLYTIELVDKKVNGDDYARIKTFIKASAKTMEENPYCTMDNEELSSLIYDETKQNSEMLSKKEIIALKIQDCNNVENELHNLIVPDVKSKKKSEKMNNYKENMAASVNLYNKYFQIYNSCELNPPSSCFDNYFENKDERKKAIQAAPILLDISLTYSVKDILIKRPILFICKYYLLPKAIRGYDEADELRKKRLNNP